VVIGADDGLKKELHRRTPGAGERGRGNAEELEICASERRNHDAAGVQFSSLDGGHLGREKDGHVRIDHVAVFFLSVAL